MSDRFDCFVIFAEMRTGSNFLEANLNAFDGLTCHGEAFNPHFIGYPNKTELLDISREARDSDPAALARHVATRLDKYNLAYMHMIEGQTGGPRDWPEDVDLDALKRASGAAYMANNGYDRDLAIRNVTDGHVDLVAFGVPYLANPDLAERLEQNAPLNDPDPDTFYGGGEEGYTDYPFLEEVAAE